MSLCGYNLQVVSYFGGTAFFQIEIFILLFSLGVTLCRVCRVKRMICRLTSDRGSSVVRP
jgi:hypothetical protein